MIDNRKINGGNIEYKDLKNDIDREYFNFLYKFNFKLHSYNVIDMCDDKDNIYGYNFVLNINKTDYFYTNICKNGYIYISYNNKNKDDYIEGITIEETKKFIYKYYKKLSRKEKLENII